MKKGDEVSFYIDTDLHSGEIVKINKDTVDVITNIGVVSNIPINELNPPDKVIEIKEIEEPIGQWVINNMKTDPLSAVQTQNGMYFYFGEVCRLVKLMKKQIEDGKDNR